MKRFKSIFLTSLVGFVSLVGRYSTARASNDLDWTNKSYYQIEEIQNRQSQQKLNQDLLNFQTAKLALINGNIRLSEEILENMIDLDREERVLKTRYLGLISFIKKDYQKVLQLIEREPYFRWASFDRHLCHLRSFAFLAQKKVSTFEGEWQACQSLVSPPYRDSSTTNFIELFTQALKGDERILRGVLTTNISAFRDSEEDIILWLKLNLLLGLEKMIETEIENIPTPYYARNEIRELLALLFYRLDKKDLVQALLENLKTPNADNLLGQLALEGDNIIEAYNYFLLALQKKPNSLHAIERAAPISWLLKNFESGLDLSLRLEALSTSKVQQNAAKTLVAAYLTRLEKHILSIQEIEKLITTFKGKLPLEAEQIHYTNALNLDFRPRAYGSLRKACLQNDALACWLMSQFNAWDDWEAALNRSDEWNFVSQINMDSLLEKYDGPGIQDRRLVDQKDIEELDGLEL